MGTTTGIEWTDSTWNPIRGCSRVSEGCRNCYAESTALRFAGEGQAFEGLAVLKNGHASWTGAIKFVDEHLLDPMKLRSICTTSGRRGDGRWEFVRRRRIFVNSVSDLFHENVTDEMRDKIFGVMAVCPQHDFQVLTKRPARMLAYLDRDRSDYWFNEALCRALGSLPMGFSNLCATPLQNVWLGVSVENQTAAYERIPLLLKTPAAVRFISAEPLLGALDLESSLGGTRWIGGQRGCDGKHCGAGAHDCPREPHHHHDNCCGRGLDWVIAGGESGPRARPMHPDWARGLRNQCAAAGVPFFFKQWGEWAKYIDRDLEDPDWRQDYSRMKKSPKFCFLNVEGGQGFHGSRLQVMRRVGKKAAGALLDGIEYRQMPEVRP